jgi:D-arabinose 1-dehydrogenase-like Zn-dependent alcohol dehydrogenase
MAAYRGDPPLRPGNAYPRLVGYCNVAEIVATGSAVTCYAVGDRILTHQSHRSAFVVEETSVLATLPSGADLVHAATTYLFHLGYNALLTGGFQPGQRVAVMGLGTLGLATVALGSAFGASVAAFSDQPDALRLAQELGADFALPKAAATSQPQDGDVAGHTGIDLVVTTSNTWDDWLLALRLASRGGTICVLGFPGRTEPVPPFNPLDSQYFYD